MSKINEWLKWYEKINIEGDNAPSIDKNRKMKAMSLFTGITGIDLACELCGIESIAFCDNDPFSQEFLKTRYDAYIFDEENQANNEEHIAAGRIPIFTDVMTLNKELLERAKIQLEEIELLHGGFPCQPYSVMGQRRGNEDERALYPEIIRLLREIRPRWFIGENVVGFKSMGVDGLSTDLEQLNYSTTTTVYPSLAQNAVHPRYRCFIVGFDKGFTRGNTSRIDEQSECFGNNGRETNREHVSTIQGEILSSDTARTAEDIREHETVESDKGTSVCADSTCTRFIPWNEGEYSRWSELDTRSFNGEQVLKCSLDRVNYGNAAFLSKHYKAQVRALGNAVNPIQVYPLIRYIRHIDDLIFADNSKVELYDVIEERAKRRVNELSEEEINEIKSKFATAISDEHKLEIYVKVKCNPKICLEYNPYRIGSLNKDALLCKHEKDKEVWMKADYHNVYKTNVAFADLVIDGTKSKGEKNNYVENQPLVDAIWNELVISGKLKSDIPIGEIMAENLVTKCSGDISGR